jgi:four helix bundle protein
MEQSLDNIANELAKEIIQYSVNLPENDALNLKKKLSLSARLLPSSIRTFNQKKERIDKMKSLIVASSNLSDCKEILEISQRLKYGNVDNITEKINNLDKYLSKNVFF